MHVQQVSPVLLDAADIAHLPAKRLRGMESARLGDSVSGVMTVEPGSALTSHRHSGAHHHVWVIDGACTILGRPMGPGSYAHIPAGVEHEIVAGPEGARIFYLFVESSGATAV